MGGSYSEMGDATPNKRQREEPSELKVPHDLMGPCIVPIKRSIDRPNREFHTICHWIQTIRGDDEQILTTVEEEIVAFRNDAAEFPTTGLDKISEIDRGNELGRVVHMLLNAVIPLAEDIGGGGVRKRKRQPGVPTASALEIGI